MKSLSYIKPLSLLGGMVIIFVLSPLIPNSPFVTIRELLSVIRSDSMNEIYSCLGATFIRFIAASVIGTFFGIIIGILQSISRPFSLASMQWLDILRVVPAIVWVPILIAGNLGANLVPVFLGSIYAMVYVALHVTQNLSEIHLDEQTFLKGLGATREEKIEYSYLPRIISGTAAGARLGGSIALILVIVGENMTGIKHGLGSILSEYMTANAVAHSWVVVLIIGSISIITFYGLSAIVRLSGAKL